MAPFATRGVSRFRSLDFRYNAPLIVPANRPSKSRNRKAPQRLLLNRALPMEASFTIPTRWLNSIVALFLLPVVWVLTAAFFSAFAHIARRPEFWRTEEFLFFALGTFAWLLVFCASLYAFGEPRPLRVYVFGHELTHAIWAKAMGGKVFAFEHSREGGFVVTDKHNFLIALAPYFHPLYAIMVIAAYGAASVFYDLSAYTPALFALLGITWSFHFSFTIWMILKGQSDLAVNGTFFSLVLIYLLNLILLAAVLVFVAPEVTFLAFW
ncbi:MAG: hypothetical protein ABIO94_04150, partial [Opitutaceae bacterium]